MKLKYFINANKGITVIILLSLMAIYRQWDNPTAWVYCAMHGTYGMLWIMKSHLFPDASWEKKTTLWYGLISWFALALYWFPGWWINWQGVVAPPYLLAIAISMNSLGTFFVFSGDMQKYTALKLAPGSLITDGLFKWSRNINYFGELLIYLSFALLAMSWLAFLPLFAFMAVIWIPNMLRKDKILAQMHGGTEYRNNTHWFLPLVF